MRDRNVWWHWQNLNERRNKPDGSPFWHGRAWLHFFAWCFNWEWHCWGKSCHIGVDFGGKIGGDELLAFKIAFPPVALYLNIDGPTNSWLWHLMPERGRECEIAIHNWALWINPWSKEFEWCAKDPWWVRGLTFHIDDFIWGKVEYEKVEPREPERVTIELDGREYHGTATFKRATWKRPRWFAKTRESTWISMDPRDGLPHAGKGDCGYDCGDDALCGWGCEGFDVPKAIATGIEKVLKYRQRYGKASEQAA
jgi:hypothetical protein